MSTLYLAKANDELISECQCESALATYPPQMDCPWCGCGWLFTCIECRKAFTFAKAVTVEDPLEELARRDIIGLTGNDDGSHRDEWLQVMRELLSDVEEGRQYVYLDGFFLPADIDEPLEVVGWHSRHMLDFLPQVEALNDERLLDGMLGSQDYWLENQIDGD